ncbi:GNAT family N-acetyltransferase [Microbacter margulisiae]|uniref:GNAT superfamily N-acetyltransferase n=1 Tax=Microbacter margulisiae TaxID=1350067 RepID=A0A7W5DNS8_9PORP|nr:GNAT family N-acetyltransferase [Microbacter margulisiae]MBB3186266.1 GNAT superfamily N-acetyltransferase [Microbacter margulisiae]
MKQLELHVVQPSEKEQVFSMLRDAALWLKEKKIDYWQSWLNSNDPSYHWIEEGINAYQFYFVVLDSSIVGMFRLQWNDEEFWGVQNDDAGYVHSFTVDRKYKGKELGKQILLLIEQVCKEHHKKYVRLDCGAHIKALCDYYENAGFVDKGDVLFKTHRLKLYEKRIPD